MGCGMVRRFGWVYFVRAPEVAKTKVGWTLYKPLVRMNELQTGSPCKLVLDGVIPTIKDSERKFHQIFRVNRSHGEWFNDSDLLTTFRTQLSFPCHEFVDADFIEYQQIADAHREVRQLENLIPEPSEGLRHCMIRAFHDTVKPALQKVVGWNARQGVSELMDSRSYDIVYDALWFLTPLCMCCSESRTRAGDSVIARAAT